MKTILFGKLDAVFLCHGVVVEKNLKNCTTPDFDQTLLINVRSNVHLISLAFPFLK
jgi:NAD(P)-dependent dehydrogenase (short-subunit alcohol dehydrogenase family)